MKGGSRPRLFGVPGRPQPPLCRGNDAVVGAASGRVVVEVVVVVVGVGSPVRCSDMAAINT